MRYFVRWLPNSRWGFWRLSSGWALDLGPVRIGYHTRPLRVISLNPQEDE